jgi:hypothetical protein
MSYEIIDNALPLDKAQEIHDVMLSDNFAWYGTKNITFKKPIDDKLFYMTHQFYQEGFSSSEYFVNWYSWFKEILNVQNIIRMKGNFYPGQKNLTVHPEHVDYCYNNTAAIYYVNDNDGHTVIDGEKVNSIFNRLVIFDGQTPHSSTDCTNAHARININFNYYKN